VATLSTRAGGRWQFGQVSCMVCTGQGNDFELIPVAKMETRNAVEGYFGSEFLVICNHCRVMAAWSHKTLKIVTKFFKRPFAVKFCSESSHRDTDRRIVFKFLEIWPTGNQWNRLCTYLTKKVLPGSPVIATVRITPRICQGLAPTMYSRVLQILSKSVYFRRSISWTREHQYVPSSESNIRLKPSIA